LLSWYGGHDLIRAQTVAFATWLVGHVFLALNMRSEKQPLLKLGLFSNRLMVVWVLATFVFSVAVTTIPFLEAGLKTSTLVLSDWEIMIPLALVGTFWIEARKWLLGR
jgi:P-type Ca2+ transporter type 2C